MFIQENVFDSVVCEMAAIFYRPQCVKKLIIFNVNGETSYSILKLY